VNIIRDFVGKDLPGKSLLGRGTRFMLAATLGASLLAAAPARAEEAASSQLATVYSGIPHDALYALHIDGKNGLAVGAAGLMLETKDGGASWSKAESGTEFGLFGIAMAGTHKLIVG